MKYRQPLFFVVLSLSFSLLISGTTNQIPAQSMNAGFASNANNVADVMAPLPDKKIDISSGFTTTDNSGKTRNSINSPGAESSKISASNPTVNAQFGSSTAIEGDTLVIGAPLERDALNVFRGAVYVYVRNGNGWTQQARLASPSNAINPIFGTSVAISGDRIIVGASYESTAGTNDQQGAAYIFVRNGSDWTLERRLVAPDGATSGNFGVSVAIQGNTAVVGASFARVQNIITGAAYVFVASNGLWSLQTKLIDEQGGDSDRFGVSVGIDGDTIAVGANGGHVPGQGVALGIVCVFTGTGASWTKQARLNAADGRSGDTFGVSLDIESDTLIVGAAGDNQGINVGIGSAYVFVRNGTIWTQQQKLTAPNDFNFGCSVSLSGNTAIIGSDRERVGSVDGLGAAHVFTRNGNTWTRQARLTPSDGRAGGEFGFSVAVSGNDFIVGAPLNHGTVASQGIVYYFISPTTAPDLQAASDTGISNTDNITNLRNLSFDIAGVTNGSTVELLRNGVVVDSRLAIDSVITLSDTDIPADQPVYYYTSRQTINGKVGSQSEVTAVTVDTTPPIVAVNQQPFQSDPTSLGTANFRIDVSEAVFGLDASDVSFAGSTANLSGTNVVINQQNPLIYALSVYNIIADNQTVVASIPAGSVSDTAGNLNLNSITTDNTITVDNVAPRVTINQAANQIDPTANLPINFTVVFSEPVMGFNNTYDVSLDGSTANTSGATINITGSGTTYNVAVGNITSNGQSVRIAVQPGVAQDALGNRNVSSTSTDNVVTVDNVRPSVTINQAVTQSDPASNQPVNFTVVFDEAVTGFEAADVSLVGSTANVSMANIVITGSGRTYNVAVSNIASSGQVRASIVAGAAKDAVGNLSFASTSSDNTITVNVRNAFDFDGDGKADVSVFRPSDGVWYLLNSSTGFTAAQFGVSTDKIVPADYDGDGKTDVAVYRNGTWYIQRSRDGFTGVIFGAPDDIPVPADFDGDGKAEVAVFRPSNGVWYIYNLSTNQFTAVQFGQMGDIPVVGDYDGDGKADVAVYRPSQGTWYLNRSQLGFTGVQFGASTDKPVPADYDGDGKTDIGVFRPSNGTWYLNQSSAGFTGVQFGISTDLPVPSDYDGDGKADIAVFRSGTWYLNRSTAGFTGVAFGASTDKPVPNAFVP